MDKKGLSVVELIVSFVLCILVFVFIIQVVSSVEELYVNLGIKTELLNKQSLISEEMNNKFTENKTILIKKCGNNCLTFFYRDNTSEIMTINKEKNTFSFGNNTYNFDGLGFVDSLTITTSDDPGYGQGILTINLNVKNSIFDNGKYVIKALYQYDSNKTIYSASEATNAEIILLGPAISYKFSEDLFIEPGWIVYYPDGKITINGPDVIPGELEYDDDGNGFIRYTGVGDAAGQEKERVIKNYETAKAHIIDLYENSPTAGLYLYGEMGKYVYKGANPENYLAIGSKLFRILSLDIQNKYVLDDDGNVVVENGEKLKESKYLLKVVSEDYISDGDGNTLLPYGNDMTSDLPLFNTSAWSRTICTNASDPSTCKIYKQYINTIVNDVWLQGLLNTGTGKLQITNGTFNTGIVNWNRYYLGGKILDKESESYAAKELFDVEGSDATAVDGMSIDPGKWHGNCLEDVCGPNAGIYSLTDILFASADDNCLTEVVVTMDSNLSVACANKNWLWVITKKDEEDRAYYRLMTRNTVTNTWLLTETNSLLPDARYEKHATRGTLYLDADLYIMGTGTKDNPYTLYTIGK